MVSRSEFYDYESYVRKFRGQPSTTDDTFTPEGLYRDLLDYINRKIFPLSGYQVERPFYPGGDYQAYAYAENSVVIDNPPFSILSKILDFYRSRQIKYFLFIPILTAKPSRHDCLILGPEIIYQNAVSIKTGFRTNLLPGVAIKSDPELYALIEESNILAKRLKGKKLTPNIRPAFPAAVTTVGKICSLGGQDWELRTEDFQPVKLFREDDGSPFDAYGYPFRVPEDWIRARQEEKARAAEEERRRTEIPLLWRDREDYD
ncbi:MAG: hypothetical protein II387_06150 [Oscillospiraceae bacterium]|nr:hypothetical protein [Oscillospiraceae bacterium]